MTSLAELILLLIAGVLTAWSVSLVVRLFTTPAGSKKRAGMTVTLLAGVLAVAGAVAAFVTAEWVRVELESQPILGLAASNWAAIALTLGGLLVVVRGVYGDRARGRRRCARCWYDMDRVDGRRCPECGHEAKSEKALLRPRRVKPAIAAGVVLVVLAIVLNPALRWYQDGWRAAIPTWVLIHGYDWLPDDLYVQGSRRYEKGRLDDRLANNSFSIGHRSDESLRAVLRRHIQSADRVSELSREIELIARFAYRDDADNPHDDLERKALREYLTTESPTPAVARILWSTTYWHGSRIDLSDDPDADRMLDMAFNRVQALHLSDGFEQARIQTQYVRVFGGRNEEIINRAFELARSEDKQALNAGVAFDMVVGQIVNDDPALIDLVLENAREGEPGASLLAMRALGSFVWIRRSFNLDLGVVSDEQFARARQMVLDGAREDSETAGVVLTWIRADPGISEADDAAYCGTWLRNIPRYQFAGYIDRVFDKRDCRRGVVDRLVFDLAEFFESGANGMALQQDDVFAIMQVLEMHGRVTPHAQQLAAAVVAHLDADDSGEPLFRDSNPDGYRWLAAWANGTPPNFSY